LENNIYNPAFGSNMAIQKPRGTRDFLPDEMRFRRWAEGRLRDTARRYGYEEVMTPTFETLDLFVKKSGPNIISEVYDFQDKGGRKMALRPELTASVVRMAIEGMTHVPKPMRVFYMSNCFRYDRPQMGRYREFYQFGAELLGFGGELVDVEIIDLACSCLSSMGVVDFQLKVGNISIIRSLLDAWSIKGEKQTEILQILDKNEEEEALRKLEGVLDSPQVDMLFEITGYSGERAVVEETLKPFPRALDAFISLERTCEMLVDMGWETEMDLSVVRGLDYYTGMVFEIEVESLGAEKQVCGGGAYSLGEVLGGQKMDGCGFAIGFDRVLLTIEPRWDKEREKYLVIPMAKEAVSRCMELSSRLRDRGFTAIMSVEGRSVGKAMKYANSIDADFAVIVGEDELKNNTASVKNLKTGKQTEMTLDELC